MVHLDLIELAQITGKLKKYKHGRREYRHYGAAFCPIHKIMFWLVGISVVIATVLVMLTAESPISREFQQRAWAKDGGITYHLKVIYERNTQKDRETLKTLGDYISCLNSVPPVESAKSQMFEQVRQNIRLLTDWRNRSLLPACAVHETGSNASTRNILFNWTMDDVIKVSNLRNEDGSWRPSHCLPSCRIAVIIPHRDREQHLATLLYYLHPHLQKQNLEYRIFVAHQIGKEAFNKGALLNAGFQYAQQNWPADCVIFHDVDLVPEDDRIKYSCSKNPRHLSVKVSTLDYKLPYSTLVGGILAITPEQFVKCNGFSNLFYNWGGEDDDMSTRIIASGMSIDRPVEADLYRFTMAVHNRTKVRPYDEQKLLENTAPIRPKIDGLTSSHSMIISFQEFPHHTRLYVQVESVDDLRQRVANGCYTFADESNPALPP